MLFFFRSNYYFVVMQKGKLFISILGALFFIGCEGYHTKLHTLDMTVSEAPEVHGANTSQAPHSASWRITGKINSVQKKEVKETTKSSSAYSENTDITYKIGGKDFSGKADFLYKIDGFFFGTGLGYKDGIYHHFTLGANLQHVEFGLFFGLYHQYYEMDYDASRCEYEYNLFSDKDEKCEAYSDSRQDFFTSPFIGAFASIYIDKFFINYSASVYSPRIKIEENSPDLAAITTQYITAGIRINRWIELSAGTSITYINKPQWYHGFTGGISFYAM